MKKFIIQIVALLVVIFGALFLVKNPRYMPAYLRGSSDENVLDVSSPTSVAVTNRLKIGNATLRVEIADTKEKRTKGLGDRDALAQNDGMLFLFDQPGLYKFWMKGLKFPLDIIWIRNNTVVDILKYVPAPLPEESDASLPVYAPVTEVDRVLEVNAGFVDAQRVKVGDKIQFLNQ
jgi:uncharacterized protein